jgi:hypothetical protein
MALTIPITLSISGTASAAVGDAAQLSAPAPAYVNQAQAGSQTDGWTDYDVEWQLEQTTAAVVNAENSAVASTSYCHDCGAIAIGFQVLVVSKQDLTSITAHNTATATSYSCVRCNNLAGAYQIVVATNSPEQLTLGQALGLAEIQSKLETIQRDGLSADRSQQLADGLANEAVAVLGGGSGAGPNRNGPDLTPAANNSNRPADLTENSGPVVNLYVKYQY